MITSIIHSHKKSKNTFPTHDWPRMWTFASQTTLHVAFCITLGGIVLPGGCCCLAGFCPMKREENTGISNDQSHDSHVSVCVSCGLWTKFLRYSCWWLKFCSNSHRWCHPGFIKIRGEWFHPSVAPENSGSIHHLLINSSTWWFCQLWTPEPTKPVLCGQGRCTTLPHLNFYRDSTVKLQAFLPHCLSETLKAIIDGSLRSERFDQHFCSTSIPPWRVWF